MLVAIAPHPIWLLIIACQVFCVFLTRFHFLLAFSFTLFFFFLSLSLLISEVVGLFRAASRGKRGVWLWASLVLVESSVTSVPLRWVKVGLDIPESGLNTHEHLFGPVVVRVHIWVKLLSKFVVLSLDFFQGTASSHTQYRVWIWA